MRRGALLTFLVSGIMSFAHADARGTWTNYTYSNKIYDITVYDTYVWCATEGGVVRWDTRDGSYTTYTTADGLLENWVYSIDAASDGDIWCGMFTFGVCHFNGDTWTSYLDRKKLVNPGAITVGLDGAPWVGTHMYGLFRFDGTDWIQIDTSSDAGVHSLDVAPDGTIWGGFGVNDRTGEGGGVRVYDNSGRIALYTTEHGLGNNFINRVAIGGNGEIWCCSGYGFISRLDGGIWTTYESAEFMGWGFPGDIAVSNTGELWITIWGKNEDEMVRSYGNGVVRYKDGHIDLYSSDDGLANNNVYAVETDDAGNVWFGMENGLSVFDGETWKTFRTEMTPIIRDVVAIAAQENGVFWCGTDEGVLRFDNGGWSLVTTDDGLADSTVTDIEIAPDGDVWFGTLNGISRFDGTDWTTYRHEDGLISDEVDCIHIMPDGIVWIGTRGGVSRFDGETWVSYDEDDGLCGNYVSAIDHASNGDIWFGTYNNGASRFDGSLWETYTGEDGLFYDSIEAIAVDHDGNIWFSVRDYPVRKGVSETDEPGAEKPAGMFPGAVIRFDGEEWELYTYRDGLPSNWITAIEVTSGGDIWFSTSGEGGYGVSKFDGDRMTIYSTADGLAGDQVRTVHAGQDGKIYFGTSYGLSVFTPSDHVGVERTEILPPVVHVIGSYPNPFNPVTTISFILPQTSSVKLNVYTITGAKIATLADGVFSAGVHSVTWDASGYASGVYFYRMKTGDFERTGKMLLVK